MPIIKKPFILAPLNDNPAVISVNGANLNVSGGFSHKAGFPTVKFSLPPQPVMLEMSSLRLTGQLLVKQGDGSLIQTLNTGATYSNGKSGADSNVPADVDNINKTNRRMIPATAVNLPNWGGVKNVIDKVVIQSKKSLIELTNVNNYGQYSGITEAYNNNDIEYLQKPLIRNLASGANAKHVNRRMLTCANTTTANESAMGTNSKYQGQFFSMPLQVDLLGGQNLFLDDDYLGGLLLTIHLNPDSALFHKKYKRSAGEMVAKNDVVDNVSYVLKNVRLEGRYLVPDQNDMANIPSQLTLNSRLNLINDVHSSTNANSYTPQLQSVKSIVNVFLDNDQQNNVNANQNNFRRQPGEKSHQQAKNGMRFPHNYETFLKPNIDSSVEFGAGTYGPKTLQFPVLSMGDCEVRMEFERALLNGKSPYHTSVSEKLTNNALKEDIDDTAPGGDNGKNDNTQADCVGIGADYTLNVGLTQQFVNQDYNLTAKSAVNTGNAKVSALRNGGTVANPLLQQTFVRYNAMFDTQNLVKVI